MQLGPEPTAGLLIAVEGTDGSGKTTLVQGLATALRERGLTVFPTLQPTPSLRATDIFKLALGNDAPVDDYRALYLATLGDRLYHCSVIVTPRLAAGEVVISDRFVFTTFANLLARGHAFEPWLREVCGHLPRPHLTLWADAPPELAVARIRARPDDKNPLDPEYLAHLHTAFAAMADPGDLTRVDTSGEPASAIAEALSLIEDVLRERGAAR